MRILGAWEISQLPRLLSRATMKHNANRRADNTPTQTMVIRDERKVANPAAFETQSIKIAIQRRITCSYIFAARLSIVHLS